MHRYKNLAKSKWGIFFIALLACGLWGSAFPVIKITYKLLDIQGTNILSKIFLAGLRFLIASFILVGYKKVIVKGKVTLNKDNFILLILLGLFQTSLQYFFFYIGLAYSTGIKSSILTQSSTLFIVLIAHFIYEDDKLDFNKIIGLILGFIGIAVVNFDENICKGLFEFNILGEGFLIMTGFASAVGTIIAKKMSKDIHPIVLTVYQMFFGSMVLLLISLSSYQEVFKKFSLQVMGLLIYSSFLSATAFSLWYWLLKYNKAGKIAMYKFIIPITGSVLSSVFLPEEHFTYTIIIGLILVAISILVVNKEFAK